MSSGTRVVNCRALARTSNSNNNNNNIAVFSISIFSTNIYIKYRRLEHYICLKCVPDVKRNVVGKR